MFDYPVTLTPEGDTVLVTFANVPEAITFGTDEDEALSLAPYPLAGSMATLRFFRKVAAQGLSGH